MLEGGAARAVGGFGPHPAGRRAGRRERTGLGWEMVGAAVLDGSADRPIFVVRV